MIPSGQRGSFYTNKSNVLLRVAASILIGCLITELFISNISLAFNVSSISFVTFFIVLASVYALTQYIILSYLKHRMTIVSPVQDTFQHKLRGSLMLIQFVLVGIVFWLVLDIVFTSSYDTFVLTLAVFISYMTGITIVGLLSFRFLLWYKANRTFVILLYSIATATITLRLIITLVFYGSLLLNVPLDRNTESEVFLQEFDPDSILNKLNDAYRLSSMISVMLMWVSTALLLRYYYKKLGEIRYWAIVLLVPLYSMSDFVIDIEDMELLNYQIFVSFQGVAAGILFGIPFWVMSRSVSQASYILRDYMMISCYGLVLFFISGSVIIDHVPYPSFGIILITSIGLSSYLIFNALYSSAVLVAADAKLRRFIRRSVIKESSLLDSIGSAEMNQQMAKKIIEIAKKETEKIGLESDFGRDEEMKEYIDNVLEEIRKTKSSSK